MRTPTLCMLLLVLVAPARADWTYLRDFDRGKTPNEVHKNIVDVHLTTAHARPGHVAYAFRPAGAGWVTRYNLWHNWTWYDRVAFRMFNANDKPVTFTYEIRTRHNRRANTKVTVKPGANDVVAHSASRQACALGVAQGSQDHRRKAMARSVERLPHRLPCS